MLRTLTIFLALLAVLGQALAGTAFPRTAAEEISHVLAHADEAGHRHHGHDHDPGLQLEPADESAFHVHLDGSGAACLPTEAAPPAAAAQSPGLPWRLAVPWRSRTPEGLLRPPQQPS